MKKPPPFVGQRSGSDIPHIFQVSLCDLLELAPASNLRPRWLPGLQWASPSTPLDVALMWEEPYQAPSRPSSACKAANLGGAMTPLHDETTGLNDAEPSETEAATAARPARRARLSACGA